MTYISKNKQSFGIVAKDYKRYRGSYTSSLYEALFSLMLKKQDQVSILDLGCGVGNSTEPLLKTAKKFKIKTTIIGCDPDQEMLKEARKSAKQNMLPVAYVQGSAEKLPFEKESFDVIISGAAFHWFATAKAMKEIQRVLRKNGMYFVFWTQNIKSNKPTIGDEIYKKYKFKGIPQKLRDPKFVKDLFLKAGFLKVKIMKIPYTEKKTLGETIGLIKTNSGYAVLSSADKKKFIQEIEKEYKKALGNKQNLLQQEIHVCFGIK